MNDLITFVVESIERNISDWTEDEVKERLLNTMEKKLSLY